MLKLVKLHLFPFISSIILAVLLYINLNDCFSINEIEIKGKVTLKNALQDNYSEGVKDEINFLGNIGNRNVINILGSSELGSTSNFIPFKYLPSEFNKQSVAFGHAHHQSFAIFTELLAAQEYLEDANICIMVSPSWFETDGTNIEAFIEFVPANFLKSIYHNKNIPIKFKKEIGLYLKAHYNEIESPSVVMKEFIKFTNDKFWNSYIKPIDFKVDKVNYRFSEGITFERNEIKSFGNKHFVLMDEISKEFIKKNKSNNIFVEQSYFDQYLNSAEKPYEHSVVELDDFSNQREMNDFELLVEVLKLYNCNATFVIQPLNPYHYKHIELYKPTIDKIENIIKKKNFNYLNMFVYKKKDYVPSTLNDIMHVGDLGWLKIDHFLLKSYEK